MSADSDRAEGFVRHTVPLEAEQRFVCPPISRFRNTLTAAGLGTPQSFWNVPPFLALGTSPNPTYWSVPLLFSAHGQRGSRDIQEIKAVWFSARWTNSILTFWPARKYSFPFLFSFLFKTFPLLARDSRWCFLQSGIKVKWKQTWQYKQLSSYHSKNANLTGMILVSKGVQKTDISLNFLVNQQGQQHFWLLTISGLEVHRIHVLMSSAQRDHDTLALLVLCCTSLSPCWLLPSNHSWIGPLLILKS